MSPVPVRVPAALDPLHVAAGIPLTIVATVLDVPQSPRHGLYLRVELQAVSTLPSSPGAGVTS